MVDVSCLGVTRSFALTASFFFFNDTATTEIYTLSLHDALPIYRTGWADTAPKVRPWQTTKRSADGLWKSREVEKSKTDRKSTRLNSSHGYISYAVFCLKKKKRIDAAPVMSSRATRRHVGVQPRT